MTPAGALEGRRAMDAAAILRAARLLVAARLAREPLDRLPEDCRPATLDDAFAIQVATVAALGDAVAGWKVARLPDGRIAWGIVLASRLVASGASVAARDMPMLGIEAEVAFRFLRDVPPRTAAYSGDEIAERVIAFPAVEIVATRYRDYHGTPVVERIADMMSNGALAAGEAVPGWRSMDFARLHVTQAFDDTTIVDTHGGHVTGDPLALAVALANALRDGAGVRAGQVVTAGTYTGMHSAKPGQRVAARFAGFGAVDIHIA